MAGRPGRTLPQPAAPARKAKAGQARKAAAAPPSLLGRVFARPGMIVAGASFAAVMTGIVANALILQKGHHPSPLFSPAPAAVTQPAAVPVPPPVPRQALEQPAPAAEPPPAAPAVDEAPAAPAVAARPAGAAHAVAKMPPAHHAAATHPAPAHPEAAAHKAAASAHKPASNKDPIAQLLGKSQ